MEKRIITVKDLLDEITPLMQAQTDARMGIAARLDDALIAKGWTDAEFAKKMGQKNKKIVAKWLSGTHNFSLNLLVKLEQILEVKLLITDSKNKAEIIEREFPTPIKKSKAS